MRTPRVVLVSRRTELEELLERHATREMARFFLESRGRSLGEVEERHARVRGASERVRRDLPSRWRIAAVDRRDLPSFLFEPDDFVVVVGQDGLVANVAKYLAGQPVLGIDPEPGRNPGVLVRFPPESACELLGALAAGRLRFLERTLVEARLDDGQAIRALNEVFVGHRTHQSARYAISQGDKEERQSSSGLIVATGTGATGWAASIARQSTRRSRLPAPEEDRLVFFVREPWPSPTTGCTIEQGSVDARAPLQVRSEMGEGGTIFGDGIESDWLPFGWGQMVTIGLAPMKLRQVLG